MGAPIRGAGLFLATAAVVLGAIAAGPLTARARAAAPSVHPTTKVVLFTPNSSDPLVARIEAELAAVGITVLRLPVPPDAQLEAAITREIAGGASAAIRVIPRSRGTEVWTGETTARVLRRRSIRADTSDATLSVIALRTVEFLRASLLDVKRRGGGSAASVTSRGGAAGDQPGREPGGGERPQPERAAPGGSAAQNEKAPPLPPVAAEPATPSDDGPAAPRGSAAAPPAPRPSEPPTGRAARARTTPDGEPAPPPILEETLTVRPRKPEPEPEPEPEPTPSPARTRPSQYEVTAGPGVVASPGGVTPIVAATVLGRAWMSRRLGGELMAVFPMAASHLTHPEGSIDIKAALFGAAVAFRLTPPGRWTADASIGLCAQFFQSAGSAVGSAGGSPNQGRADSLWKAAAHGRVGGGVEINRWLMLRADVVAGVAPSSRITISYSVMYSDAPPQTVDRATWGPVFAAGLLGLQADW